MGRDVGQDQSWRTLRLVGRITPFSVSPKARGRPVAGNMPVRNMPAVHQVPERGTGGAGHDPFRRELVDGSKTAAASGFPGSGDPACEARHAGITADGPVITETFLLDYASSLVER
jgi:hypothetical protein